MRKIFISALFVFALTVSAGCSSAAEYDIKSGPVSAQAGETSADFKSEEDTEEPAETEAPEDPVICVYVCGEVASPGVYELPEGSRVYEAVDAAGGLLEGVDTTGINMAEKLADGQQITVCKEGAYTNDVPGASDPGGEKVNLNTADMEELMTLSGIGESRAGDIIEYRTTFGKFSSVEDIMNVSGIGEKMFEKIKDDIEV